MDRFDKAIAILKATNDGNDLTSLELWIIQEAVNNRLNAKGWEKFEEMFQKYSPSPKA